LATGWTVRGLNPGGRQKLSVLHKQSGPAVRPSGYRGSHPGVKRPGREADQSPPSSTDIKNRWSHTSAPPTRRHGAERDKCTFNCLSRVYCTRSFLPDLVFLVIKLNRLYKLVRWPRLAMGWTVWGSNPAWGRDFPHSYRPALGPTYPPVQWVPDLPGVEWPGRGVDHLLHLAPRLKKE
jgi:hypothetical protein